MQPKFALLPLALFALSPGLMAQQIPGAGSQLNQLPPVAPPERAAPTIKIEAATSPVTADSAAVKVLVNELNISGARVYPEAELLALTRFEPGSQLTLQELQVMASRVTAHYRKHGYFVARAYLPVQDITGHVVTIAVSEGNYGQVTVRNSSHLSNGHVDGVLGGLDSGDVITIEPLESRLLLLSDIPGVKVTSTLVPGTLPGSSDLIVDVVPGQRITGFVDLDNAGNPYTGEWRIGALVNFNNPFGRGDVASLRVLTSGSGLKYGRAAYQTRLGRATVGIAYSRLEYELGKQFEPLGAHGTADIASLFGSIPLLRSRDSNLNLGLTLEDKRFDDRIDLFPADGREAGARTATVFLYGDHRDDFGGGGLSTFYVGLTAGKLDIQTPQALIADAASARTNGRYNKLWFRATRSQHVTEIFSLHGAVIGQLASKNLDPSEKLVLGGMDGIRAYPQGEGFGDQGYLVNLEAQLLLKGLSEKVPGQVRLLAFVDGGKITINKEPWFAGDNTRNLMAAGMGVSWNDPGNFSVRMYYAHKLGGEDATSAPDKSGRFWIQAVKYF